MDTYDLKSFKYRAELLGDIWSEWDFRKNNHCAIKISMYFLKITPNVIKTAMLN